MPSPRHRERNRSIVAGTVSYPANVGTVIAGPSLIYFEGESMDDVVGKKRRLLDPTGVGLPPSNCVHHYWKKTWVPLNGSATPESFGFISRPSDYVLGTSVDHLPIPSEKYHDSETFYATRLLARTNPTRSEYSVPVAIKELVDVTSLFKLAAKSFTKFVGGAYLNYRFGWLQFINDVKTLATIVESVNSRVRELNSLAQHGGLRRRVDLDAYGVSQTSSFNNYRVIQSTYGVTLYGEYTYHTQYKIWGSVRWYPRDYTELPTEPADVWLAAVRQVFDLEMIDSETAYNLIPWSWLLDYFSNLGEFLAANEGGSQVVPRDMCIMWSAETHDVLRRARTGTISDNISGGAYHGFRQSFYRFVIPEPPASAQALPSLLSVEQFKVVLALLARFRG
jgi:hypothetical protein